MIKIGQKISDINADAFYNEEIIRVNFSDYRGKWLILIFYPADFTFICPTELEEMATLYDSFKEIEAEVLSISVDTAFVHKAWHDNSPSIRKIKFPMVSDANRKICQEFGTLIDDEGLSLRASFIIDPDGIIKTFEMNDNSIGRSGKELLRKLRAAKFVRENKGMVCPVNWEPGKDAIKPDINLIGKI